ncbi:uncharacterized protein LOC129789483 isoform X2 [Lutzomyia longipalpis]|uniref:uncharacterized protein LOC129789483 isoform X2 n=1 Tax=Lutzomyia longipalpis TaxID=7200 RepID=UPI0024845287|nr:uncharacterized protein LOC129789483 isoform X2 [Lutzomyia longipalpis]
MSETPPLFENSQESIDLIAENPIQHTDSINPHTFVVKRANSQEIDDVVKSEDVSLSPKKPKLDADCMNDGDNPERAATPMDLGDVEMPEDLIRFQMQSKKLREVIKELKIVERFYP